MDKSQAKFILQSFRPNGEDATDVDFRDALQLAVEDRELGEWLVDERSTDAEFAEALNGLEIPDGLRMSLLTIMHGESLEDPGFHEEMDVIFTDALTSVQPPASLRNQIIAAMMVEKNSREQSKSANVVPLAFKKKKWINVATIAATLMLGVFFAMQLDIGGKDQASSPSVSQLSSREVQQDTGKLLNSEFTMDVKHESSSYLTSWLSENDHPAPIDIKDLPLGLQSMPSMGCKKIILPGDDKASLICFLTKDKVPVHLIIVNNDLVSDSNLPVRDNVEVSNCYHCPRTDWNVVRWRDNKNTYILMTKTKKEQKDELLQYF